MAGTCRAIIETPLEYAKVRLIDRLNNWLILIVQLNELFKQTHRQTGQNWRVKDTYTVSCKINRFIESLSPYEICVY